MVGIKDIAKAAGVSISTVSYALNGSTKVTEQTRQKIMAIANELNYVPNMAARTLKRQQTNIIGVYLADYAGSFYGELLDGIKRGLAAYDYEMIVCSGQKSHLFIPERMVDGAIILDWTFQTKEIEMLANRGHQMVVLDREIANDNISRVLLDNKGGATLAIERLVAAQTKHVYLVTGSMGYDNEQRLLASTKELTRFNISYEIIEGNFTEPSGYAAAEKIAERLDQKQNETPIDIFSFNDEMAVGIYKFFADRPEKIGQDIRIVGFDNIEISSFLTPRLATIAYSKHRWGMVAAEKIIRLIQGEKVEDEAIYTTFVSGSSLS
ncbi:LacI family DNA-binding transcriptional regulator [Enterococcus montenegrensis]|uniref:LacI family DNA-binding transcriptional regulator n=1 Tax=Enterococcus montenegrensis TaxID=3031993 RepID=UPI00249EAECE|nr:LacI family DNA-binding transcriptional regulator [Enterococcus montenegrensis]WHA09226.1 LacI family DNA-binding transcriptional regulator [Enterococcus montenegrensis]